MNTITMVHQNQTNQKYNFFTDHQILDWMENFVFPQFKLHSSTVPSTITDDILNFIENTPSLKKAYDVFCNIKSEKYVNSNIGRIVKSHFGLKNTGRTKCTSKLAKTFTLH